MRRTVLRFVVPIAVVATVLTAQGVFSAAQAAEPPRDLALTIQSVPNGTMADLAGSNTSQGAAINEWTYNNAANQQWWLQRVGSHYKIKSNVNGAYCLARERTGNTAKILLRGCDTALADWDFESLGRDRYRIKDPAANLYLNTWDAKPVRGRDLVTSPNTNSGGQWYLTDVRFRKQPASGEKRLHDVTFLTAHNAHVASGDAWWIAPNQSLGIRGQLDAGVRALMLDTHVYWHEPYLCHTNDSSCGWAPGVHYGSPRRSVQWALETVVKFLNEPANRNEIVTIFLEDYVAAHDLKAVLDRTAGLNDRLFRADAFKVKQDGWPTVSEVVAQNKRLLIFSDRSDREYFGVMSGHDYTVENYWSLGNSGNDTDCRSRWDDVPLNREEPGFRRLFVMNQFRDIPSKFAAGADNGSKLRWRANEVCAAAARRKANFLAVDFIEVSNPRAVVDELNR